MYCCGSLMWCSVRSGRAACTTAGAPGWQQGALHTAGRPGSTTSAAGGLLQLGSYAPSPAATHRRSRLGFALPAAARPTGRGRQAQRWVGALPRLCDQQDAVCRLHAVQQGQITGGCGWMRITRAATPHSRRLGREGKGAAAAACCRQARRVPSRRTCSACASSCPPPGAAAAAARCPPCICRANSSWCRQPPCGGLGRCRRAWAFWGVITTTARCGCAASGAWRLCGSVIHASLAGMGVPAVHERAQQAQRAHLADFGHEQLIAVSGPSQGRHTSLHQRGQAASSVGTAAGAVGSPTGAHQGPAMPEECQSGSPARDSSSSSSKAKANPPRAPQAR